jgi:hypothetical protein
MFWPTAKKSGLNSRSNLTTAELALRYKNPGPRRIRNVQWAFHVSPGLGLTPNYIRGLQTNGIIDKRDNAHSRIHFAETLSLSYRTFHGTWQWPWMSLPSTLVTRTGTPLPTPFTRGHIPSMTPWRPCQAHLKDPAMQSRHQSTSLHLPCTYRRRISQRRTRLQPCHPSKPASILQPFPILVAP